MAVPIFLGLLAEAYGQAGQADEGLRVLAEATRNSAAHDDRSSGAADLYRLRGELLLAVSAEHQDEAEASLRRALVHRA